MQKLLYEVQGREREQVMQPQIEHVNDGGGKPVGMIVHQDDAVPWATGAGAQEPARRRCSSCAACGLLGCSCCSASASRSASARRPCWA